MSDLLAFAILFLRLAHSLPVNTPLLDSYDYIVVGGGPGGLTVANRLSEDPGVNVLLLEAGEEDKSEDAIAIPGLIGVGIESSYNWNLSTVPQTYLDGATRRLPQGRALGGSTIINGMLWNRGGQGDFDDWVQLGNPGWGWDDMLPYFKKSETFTPVSSSAIAEQFSIGEYPEVHGYAGYVNVSFPRFFWNASVNFFDALNELGVPTAYDPNAGDIAGASFLPFNLNPVTQTRCDARRAYFDPIAERPNLSVLTGQFVTQLVVDGVATREDTTVPLGVSSADGQGEASGGLGGMYGPGSSPNSTDHSHAIPRQAYRRMIASLRRVKRWLQGRQGSSATGLYTVTGVQYAANAHSPRQTVSATREVIISAGAIHSPQLLMLSGIGPAEVLSTHGIPNLVDLPGVGNNLQDHAQVWCNYPYYNNTFPAPTDLITNDTFLEQAQAAYWANRTGPWTTGWIDGVAFPSLPAITDNILTTLHSALSQHPSRHLPANTDPTVLAGYTAQLPLLLAALHSTTRAAYEILNSNDGVLPVANMRPLSRGTLTLKTSHPFDPPLINPRYGSNPTDIQILLAAILFNRRLLATSALSELDPAQLYPPVDATEEDIVDWIYGNLQTEYHPGGTCAMMPLELGGVVNSELIVYGTRNLRVVDASVFPLLPAAHLQAVVYGVAEKAADIIKGANLPPFGLGLMDDDDAEDASGLSSDAYSIAASLSNHSDAPETAPGISPPELPVPLLSAPNAVLETSSDPVAGNCMMPDPTLPPATTSRKPPTTLLTIVTVVTTIYV